MSRGYPLPAGKLDRARARRGWSVTELAEKSGLGIGTVSRALAGRPVAPATLMRIARALTVYPPIPELVKLLEDGSVSSEETDTAKGTSRG